MPPGGKLTLPGETTTDSCEVTLSVSGAETAPGPGLATVMLAAPTCAAVPVAVSCAAETKFVESGWPFHRTWAPLTKLPPLTVRVKVPSDSEFGASEPRV